MTEREAGEKGYQHTGIYSRSKSDVKERADRDIKAKGFKYVTIPQKANPYSRGQNTGIVGYSIYAERAYFVAQAIESAEKYLAEQSVSELAFFKKDYEQKVAEVEKRKSETIVRLETLKIEQRELSK